MPRSKKSRITLLSSDVFGIFLGLALGCGAAIADPLAWSLSVLVVSLFAWWRFGFRSLIVILIAFLIGYGSRFLNHASPGMEPFDGVVISSHQNYLILLSNGQRLYVPIKDNPYQLGDFLRVSGKLKPIDFPSLESQFDFETYLCQKGVSFEIGYPDIVETFLVPIRLMDIKNRFLATFTSQEAAYLKSLLFNDPLEDRLRDKLANLSVIHVIKTSGLLAYGVMVLIGKFLSLFMTEKKAMQLASVFLVPWLALNPNAVALWRLLLIKTVSMIFNKNGNKGSSYWTIRGIIGIIMLLISKYIVYNPSFYLSSALSALLHLRNRRQPTHIAAKMANQVAPMMLLLPYTAVAVGHVNLVGYLLFIPLLYVNSILALVALPQAILFTIPWLSRPLINLCFLLIDIGGSIQLTIYFPDWSPMVTLACIMLLIMFLLVQERRIKEHEHNAKWLMLLMFTLITLPLGNLWRQEVHFINVGQGDAILIKNRSKAVLVDTGGSRFIDIGSEVLIPYFHRQGVYRLDAVIITHDDFDHNGALEDLKGGFRIDKIVGDQNEFPITLAGIRFENLNDFPSSGVDDNLASIVLFFRFMNKDWLLMGDAPQMVEEAILANNHGLRCDYVKIGHHGSNTSSSSHFVSAIRAKEAIISVGRNYYGHPDKEVLKRLAAAGITIRRTDEEGTIVYKKTFSIV